VFKKKIETIATGAQQFSSQQHLLEHGTESECASAHFNSPCFLALTQYPLLLAMPTAVPIDEAGGVGHCHPEPQRAKHGQATAAGEPHPLQPT